MSPELVFDKRSWIKSFPLSVGLGRVDGARRWDNELEDLSVTGCRSGHVWFVEHRDLDRAEAVRTGGSKVVLGVEAALRAGNGLEPLGLAGRFERRLLRYSAVQAFWASWVCLGCEVTEDEKNFKVGVRRGLSIEFGRSVRGSDIADVERDTSVVVKPSLLLKRWCNIGNEDHQAFRSGTVRVESRKESRDEKFERG